MPHIHNGPGEHDWTISAYIVRTDFTEPKLLLHMHKKLHQWLQFGGHVELNENPTQAITHEITEESGYEIDQLTLLEPFKGAPLSSCISHPIPISFLTHDFPNLDHKHTDLGYAYTTDQEPRLKTADGESQLIRGFSLSELETIPDNEIPTNVREIGLYVLTNLLDNYSR